MIIETERAILIIRISNAIRYAINISSSVENNKRLTFILMASNINILNICKVK